MKKIFTFLFAILLGSACIAQNSKKGWSKEFEARFYKQIDASFKPSVPDPVERAKFVSYTVGRFKAAFPNGPRPIPADSLTNFSRQIGLDYAVVRQKEGLSISSIMKPSYKKWTPDFEQSMLIAYRDQSGIKDPVLKEKLCNCVIAELKKSYRDSILLPTPKDSIVKAASKCMSLIVTN
jgi:hypothetical protein